jgi:hypothetical protein
MALRSGTPVNLSSLQRDYSALPKIAAIKAQANQGIFDAIQSGLEKRKNNIEKAEKKTLNIKLLNQIIEGDKKNQFVPAGVTAEELSKYVPIEETLKYAQAMGIANQGLRKERQLRKAAQGLASAIPGMDEKTMRQLSRVNPELLIQLGIKARQGTEPEYELKEITDPDGTKRTVRVNVGQGTYTNINQQAPTPKSIQSYDLGGRPVSPVDPATGRPPATSVPTTKGSLTSSPSLAEQNANVKAKREEMSEKITDIYKSQARTGVVDRAGIAKIVKDEYPGLSEVVVDGIIEKDLEKIRDKAIQKLQEMEQSAEGITEYVLSLAQIDPSKGQPQGSGFLGLTGKEYEASDFGDIEADPKKNALLRTQPEILTILGVPKNTIADIMGLKPELPNELTTKTRYSVQEVPGGGLVIKN